MVSLQIKVFNKLVLKYTIYWYGGENMICYISLSVRFSYGESMTPSYSPQNTLETKKSESNELTTKSETSPASPPPIAPPLPSKDIEERQVVTVSQNSLPGHYPMTVQRTDSTTSSTQRYLQQKEPLNSAEIMAYVNPVIR